MAEDTPADAKRAPHEQAIQSAVEAAIRIGVVALLGLWVFNIVAPFIQPVVWGAIIAIAADTPYEWLVRRFGGRRALAAVIFTLFALVLLLAPTAVLTSALVDWGQGLAGAIHDGRLAIPPAPESVRGWPVIGGAVHEFWSLANTNLQAAVLRAREPLENVGVWLLQSAASAGFGIVQFALSIAIAGVLLARSEGTRGAIDRLAIRLAPDTGRHMRVLAEQTVRSVATGVVGVALLQCVLAGLAFYLVGIPGAPFLALVCLLMGMMQLPLAIPILPVIIFVWTREPVLTSVLFTAWCVPVMALDNVLKPILMGRGVDAPMLIVFIGAIGGFAFSGIVGLFVGAVVMVVAYELLKAWVDPVPAAPEPDAQARG